MLEHSSHIMPEPGLIFTFDHLCRAHFIYWYIYVYPSGIVEMRQPFSSSYHHHLPYLSFSSRTQMGGMRCQLPPSALHSPPS
jgi:hypothetical protein